MEECKSLEFSDDLLKQGEGVAELLSFVFGERTHGSGQGFYAALAALPHEADSFGRGLEADASAVFGSVPANQSRQLEAGDDAAHSGRADLFGAGKLAERPGTTEDQDGEGGKLSRADAAFAVADTQTPQQVNGGGVKLIGDVRRRHGWLHRLGGSDRFKGWRMTRLWRGQVACRGSSFQGGECVNLKGRRRGARGCGRSGVSDGSRAFRGGAVFGLDRSHER